MDGIAPGAQLIEIVHGPDQSQLIEALVQAFSDTRTDMILTEHNVNTDISYLQGDGQFVATIIASRLIQKYQKPLVVPAGNDFSVNTVGEVGNARWALTAGAYETNESFRINWGILIRDTVASHGGTCCSWGPNGVGGIKPDVVVPAGWLAVAAQSRGDVHGVKGLYRMPPGYEIGGGTSQGAPTLAGALAVLLSAAKQEHIPYDAERVWRSVTDGARPIASMPVAQQGNGAADVGAALKLLRQYATAWPVVRINSRAPVSTPVSAWYPNPGEGVGIWEHVGWEPGMHGTRTVTLTRTSGPDGPMQFAVSWRGNDGTFASDANVMLRRDTPVPFQIRINGGTVGVHSALLTLDHPTVPGHAYRLMTTIVTAEPFTSKEFIVSGDGEAQGSGPFSAALHVPGTAEALTVETAGAPLLFLRDPVRGYWNMNIRSSLAWMNPGTWDLARILDLREPRPLDMAWNHSGKAATLSESYRHRVSVLGTRVDAPASLELPVGTASQLNITITNILGAFAGGVGSMPLASVRTTSLHLSRGEQRIFELRVPESSPLLFAKLSGFAVDSADVDLFLFDCTAINGACQADGAALSLGTFARLRKPNPKSGLWKIVVDASRASSAGITVSYTDAFLDPRLGGVIATDGIHQRNVESSWTASTMVWLAGKPDSGREPQALFLVQAQLPDGTSAPVGMRLVPLISR